MSKKTAKVKTRPRKPVFDRALEDAQRRLVKAKEKRQKCQDGLVWANNEIPRLEKIIQALGGTSDIGRVEKTKLSYNYRGEAKETLITNLPRDVEILPDIPVAVPADDDNRFLPDVK